MLVVLCLAALLQAGAPDSRTSPLQLLHQIKARLAEYEDSNRREPASLRPIAQLAIRSAEESQPFEVWREVCASPYRPNAASCHERLWGVLNNARASLADRASAAVALADGGDPQSAPALFKLLSGATNRDLAQVVPTLRILSDQEATALLLRLLTSDVAGGQVAACRALGHIDTAEVRNALAEAVRQALPGLHTWNACMVARARLKEPDSVNTISGYSRYMSGDELLDASRAMVELNNEHAVFLLRRVTREAGGLEQIAAAELLAATDPAYAATVIDRKLKDQSAGVRARALVAERRLGREPSATVRSLLVDTDALVRLRAAEVILSWVELLK
jgi:hypothetical protein